MYGRERLATLTTAPGGHTRFIADALGSTRVTFTETDPWGTFAATRYTPFGDPYAPDLPPEVYAGDSIGVPQPAAPFGFTGELHDAGLVYLRARWYNPTSGVFLSRDPFGGFATRPYSLHPYQYGYANPVVWTDATGRCVGWIWDDPTCTFAGYDPRDWSWNESLDTWQVGLDVAGMVPVLGEPADALNTGISLARGDCVGAGLSLAAMVPLAGWGATAGKVGRRGVKLLPAPKVRGRANPIGQRGPFYGTPGGIVLRNLPSLDYLAQAAAKPDRNGFTLAGRALQKHSHRPTSLFAQLKPRGKRNPQNYNRVAQEIVADILMDPSTTVLVVKTRYYGEVFHVMSPSGRGIRYDLNGNFTGFLN